MRAKSLAETYGGVFEPAHTAMGPVELADELVANRTAVPGSSGLMREMFSRSETAATRRRVGNGHFPSAAEIFDAFAYPGRETLRAELEQYIDVVALPREPVPVD